MHDLRRNGQTIAGAVDPVINHGAIIDDTYAVLLETGLYTWPIEEKALRAPESAPNLELVRSILRDGIWL